MAVTPDRVAPVPPHPRRGRPRAIGAEKRIADAALEEYGERGWSGFTMDGVARRARVGKSTLYLRWRSKELLLAQAVSEWSRSLSDVDTGSLRGDLEELALRLFRTFRAPAGWAAFRLMVDVAGASHSLGQLVGAIGDVQAGHVDLIVRRASERGELAADVSPRTVGQCLYGSVIVQTLTLRMTGDRLTEEQAAQRAAELVDGLLDGLRHARGGDLAPEPVTVAATTSRRH